MSTKVNQLCRQTVFVVKTLFITGYILLSLEFVSFIVAVNVKPCGNRELPVKNWKFSNFLENFEKISETKHFFPKTVPRPRPPVLTQI